jgi:hypothetical protein
LGLRRQARRFHVLVGLLGKEERPHRPPLVLQKKERNYKMKMKMKIVK